MDSPILQAVMALSGLACSAICVVLGLVVVGAVVWWLMKPSEGDLKMKEDAKDPKKAWVQGVGLLLMDGSDYAYTYEGIVRDMLESAWGITSLEALDAQVAELEAATDERAWNLVRAFLLLRSAVAMGWLDNDASFARCRALGIQLQETYGSWEALADDLFRSRRAWLGIDLDGDDDDDDENDMYQLTRAREWLRKDQWAKTSWMLALE